MMHWYGSGMSGGAWAVMGLFWLGLLALIVFLVVRLLPAGPPARHSNDDTPEEILDRRFARGEIDLETFQAQRSALAAARGRR